MTAIPTYAVHPTGELVKGIFYLLRLARIEDQDGTGWPSGNEIVVPADHGDRLVMAEVVERKEIEERQCELDAGHKVEHRFTEVGIALGPGAVLGDVVPNHGFALISGTLAAELASSGLLGAETERVAIIQNYTRFSNPDVRLICFSGRPALRCCSIVPASANRCPFCGHGPLFCSECGYGRFFCSQCEETCVVPENEHRGAGDPRICIKRGCPLDIVEVNRWDGSDFFGWTCYGIVTKRALDFFTARHLAPLIIRPILADVANISAEKHEMLKRAVTPPT